jgi:hypothetical protein
VGYATDFGDDPTPVPGAPVVPLIDQPSQVVRLDSLPTAPSTPAAKASPPTSAAPEAIKSGSGSVRTLRRPTEDLTVQATMIALRAAPDRERVAEVLLDHMAALCARAVLFVIKKGFLAGSSGRGEGVRGDVLKAISLPLDEPSVFRDAVASRLPFRGPLDQIGWAFVRLALGKVPDEALLLPISVRDKVVAVLYADQVGGSIPDGTLDAVVHEASLAYERLLRNAKQID